MTREEAIYELDRMKTWSKELSDEEIEAIVIAIKVLDQEPCGDAISRKAAIRAIEALQLPIMREASTCYQYKFSGMSEAKEAVENLPSVTPQQRTGRWVKEGQGGRYKWMCSNCGTHHRALYDYCPSCGTRMEVEE